MDQKKKRLSILKKSVRYESSPTQTFTKSNRRISFSGIKSVKEFIAGEDKATIWGTSYEEEDRNHASVGSAQDTCNPEISNSVANFSLGMTLRSHKIVASMIPSDENKENIIVENNYDTMELANTQNIASSFDNRTFNNTMDLTLNSFELKNIKFTKPAFNENARKNAEITTDECMMNCTTSIGMDSDISQIMYCSFANEQDRKMLLQNRIAIKANARDKARENTVPSRFECEIENFTFESADLENKKQNMMEKNNSDDMNISHEIMDPGIRSKEILGRKTIVFQDGEAVDVANDTEKQLGIFDGAKTRKTILFNEELVVDKKSPVGSPQIKEKDVIEIHKMENVYDDMILDNMNSRVPADNSPEKDCKRKTMIFPKGESIDPVIENVDTVSTKSTIHETRKTIIFPMGEALETIFNKNTKIPMQLCPNIKTRETMIFERGQEIDEDCYTHSVVRSDLTQTTNVLRSTNIETETINNRTQSQENQENITANISGINLLCPPDKSRKTLIFSSGGLIDESLYKSPLLRAQSKRMTQMFIDAKMEVDECLNATPFNLSYRHNKVRNSNKKPDQPSKSRQTQIFPLGEKMDETISTSQYFGSDLNFTSTEPSTIGADKINILKNQVADIIQDRQEGAVKIDQQVVNPVKSRQTLIFEAGENIDEDVLVKPTFPEGSKRKTHLFRNVDIDVESCMKEETLTVPQKDRRTMLNECTMNETLCMNQGQDTDVSLSIFSRIQEKQQSENIEDRYEHPESVFRSTNSVDANIKQFNQSTKNQTSILGEQTNRFALFVQDASNKSFEKQDIHFADKTSTNSKINENRKTILFQEGEKLEIVESSIKNVSAFDAQKSFAYALNKNQDVYEKTSIEDRRMHSYKNEDMKIDGSQVNSAQTIMFSNDDIAENQIAICNPKQQTMIFSDLDVSKDHTSVSNTLVLGDDAHQLERRQDINKQQSARRTTCLFDNEDIDIEKDINVPECDGRLLSESNPFGTCNPNESCNTKSFGTLPYSVGKANDFHELLNKESCAPERPPESSIIIDITHQSIGPKANCKQKDIDMSFEEIAPNMKTLKNDDAKKHARRTVVFENGELVELSESILDETKINQTLKTCVSAGNRPLRGEDTYTSKKSSLHTKSPQTIETKQSVVKSDTKRRTIIFGNDESIEIEDTAEGAAASEELMKHKSRIPIPRTAKSPKIIQTYPKNEKYTSDSVSKPQDGHKVKVEPMRKTQLYDRDDEIETPSAPSLFQENMARKSVITSSPGKHLGIDEGRGQFMQGIVSERKGEAEEFQFREMISDETKKAVNCYPSSRNVQKVRRTIYFNEDIDEDLEEPVEDVRCDPLGKIYQYQQSNCSMSAPVTTNDQVSDPLIAQNYKNLSNNETSTVLSRSHTHNPNESVRNQNSLPASNANRQSFIVVKKSKDDIGFCDFGSSKEREAFAISKDSSNQTLKDISNALGKTLVFESNERPTREVDDSAARLHRGTFVIHRESENQNSGIMSNSNRRTLPFCEDQEHHKLEELEIVDDKGFENNSPTTTNTNNNLFKKLTQDSIYLSRTACCPIGNESFLATGSSLTFSPNSTAALCNIDPNKITGAGYKRSFTKTGSSKDTFYKQFKRDYAEITVDAIRESPDPYDDVIEVTGDDIDKTQFDLIDSIETISDSYDNVEVCEASVMLLNDDVKKSAIAMQQSQLMCHKCKNCQKTILNETTLAGFNLEKDLGNVELNFDAFNKLHGKPRFRDVLNEFKERRLSNCFNSTYEESILFPAVPSAEFLLNNYAEGYMEQLEETNPSDGIIGAVCPVTPPYEVLFQNRLRENGYWLCDDSNLCIGIIECRHKTVRGIRLIAQFQPQDLHDPHTSQITFGQVLMTKCNIYKTLFPFDLAVHNDIFSRISRDLTAFCRSSSQFFTFLDNMHILFDKSYQTVKKLLKIVFSNYALLQCYESENCIIRKTVFRTSGSKAEFQIRIRNVDKICADDILLPPRSYFKEDIVSLPLGIDFVKIFLSDPNKYLK